MHLFARGQQDAHRFHTNARTADLGDHSLRDAPRLRAKGPPHRQVAVYVARGDGRRPLMPGGEPAKRGRPLRHTVARRTWELGFVTYSETL